MVHFTYLDEVEIVGIHEDVRKVVVTGIEMFRKLLDEAQLVTTSVRCSVVFRETRSREDSVLLSQVL